MRSGGRGRWEWNPFICCCLAQASCSVLAPHPISDKSLKTYLLYISLCLANRNVYFISIGRHILRSKWKRADVVFFRSLSWKKEQEVVTFLHREFMTRHVRDHGLRRSATTHFLRHAPPPTPSIVLVMKTCQQLETMLPCVAISSNSENAAIAMARAGNDAWAAVRIAGITDSLFASGPLQNDGSTKYHCYINFPKARKGYWQSLDAYIWKYTQKWLKIPFESAYCVMQTGG